MKRNRWLLALCAVGIHLSIGSIYAWSQIAALIQQQMSSVHSWTLTQITVTFSIAICALGLSAAFLGRFVGKKGPKYSGIIASILFGIGLVGGGLALKYDNLTMLYITYGVLGGAGIGIGYITPVSTLLKWFPDRRGLAMGLAIMGFGFGAALEVFLLQNLLPALGITSISSGLMILGVVYFIVMFISSLYLAPPPKGWKLAGFEEKISKGKTVVKEDLAQLGAVEALKTSRFYFLWIMLFINVTCGIALIAVAKLMGTDIILLSSQAAAVMVMLMSLFNGFGRIFWANVSDYITRPVTFIVYFVLQIIAFFVLTQTRNPYVFQGFVFLILTCYGGGFSAIPAYIGDVFGTKEAGMIHGYILTAWSAAGLLGPILIAECYQITGLYQDSLYIFIGLLIIALIVSIIAAVNIKNIRKAKA